MSFFGSPDDGFVQGSRGPRIGFFDGIVQGTTTTFESQFRVTAEEALQQELLNRWEENLVQIEAGSDKKYIRLGPDAMDIYLRSKRGEPLTISQQRDFNMTGNNEEAGLFSGSRALQLLEEQEAAFKAAGLPGFEELFEEVTSLQRKVEERQSEVSERGGAGAFIGSMAGGVAGSFTTRDPTLLITSFLGGGVRSIAMRVATEAGIAGGTEAILQYGAVAENRRIAGLPEADKLQNVLFAAGGAAALRGLFEGAAVGVRRFRESAPQQLDQLDFEDAQLRQFLGNLPDTPGTRAAIDLLDEDAAARSLSPYGTSYQGLRRFTEETAEAEMALLGRSDTAVGRALPRDAEPLSIREREEDFLIVREQAPEVAARYDAAEARLAELDASIDAVTAEVQGRTVLDAVRLVDENAAVRLEVLAARTDILEEARTLEADLIFNQVGKERILRAAEDAEIAPRKQTQRLRQQRKAANKEYRAALRKMEAEREKLNAAAERVKALMSGEVKDLLGYAIATRPMQGSKLATEQVVAQRAAIAKDADTLPDRAGEALDGALTPTAGPVKVAELVEGFGEMGKAIADGYVQMIFARARAGKVTDVNGTGLPALQALKIISDGGVKLTRALTERVVRNTDRLTSKGDQFSADMRSIVLDEINEAQGLIEIAPGLAIRSDFLIPNEAGELVPIGPLIKDLDEDSRLVEAMRSCAL